MFCHDNKKHGYVAKLDSKLKVQTVMHIQQSYATYNHRGKEKNFWVLTNEHSFVNRSIPLKILV